MALNTIKPVSRVYVWAHLADSSAPSSAFTVAPCKGVIKRAGSTIYNAITAADTNITTKINATLITGLVWIIPTSGSAAGSQAVATPTSRALSTVQENDTIAFISDGGASTTCPTMFWAEIEMD